ncbi:MAG: PP2C family protein-serine/threonine phosphatase [Spirochaetia bacterium]|nr:PP2C family protein-serine/threonine phosphatase [Spirochaetia bacterium]
MEQASLGQATDAILALLAPLRGFLLALDGQDRILGVMPDTDPLPGLPKDKLTGRELITALGADFVRVYDGKHGWDELGYFLDGTGDRRPYQVRRFPAAGSVLRSLYPQASSFMLASPLSAYGALEHLHQKSLAEHARELEAMNRKLVRRGRRLKKTMDVLKARNRQIVNELNLAVELQKSLLPKAYPDTELLSFTHRYIPLAMVGGDFFDIVQLSDERFGVMVSDVSGHGVAPAFITAMIRSSFDYLVQKEETPSAVLAGINAEFSKTIDTDHFVTAFYAVFDFASMTCTFCNAGHPPQLIARRDGGFTELSPSCPVIGLSERSAYSDQTAAFGYGDVLCFYTDGVIESRNASGDMFGVEGVKATIASSITEGVDGMADRLLTDLIGFLKDPCFEDDITILFGQVLDSL